MRALARTLLLLVFALPALGIAVVWLCFEDVASVVRGVELTPQAIERAKSLVERNDPRDGLAGRRRRTVVIGEHELDLMLNYAASRLGHGAAQVSFGPGTLRVRASMEIARGRFGPYLNLDATLRETEALPRIERLLVGGLRVPGPLADFLLRQGLRWLAATDPGGLAADIVERVSIGGGRLVVDYAWSGEIEARARSALLSATVSAAEHARLRAYHDRLVEAVAGAQYRISLARLMPPLFRAALDRGARGDIRAENRAAIVVLAFYANGTDLAAIVPSAAAWPRPARRTVTIVGRNDFARHFMVSAAIAAAAGSPLADAIGLYKEIDDARAGSGFSFSDIGADRAGVRFGEVATGSVARARSLARAIAAGVTESDFMPPVLDLPEFMPQAEFERRFGGVGGREYEKMMATIESRVASRPLLR